MSISSGFIVLAYEHTFVQARLSLIVIPDLIREPVVFRHVVGLRVYSTGSRIKSGMTISECLTRKRVYAFGVLRMSPCKTTDKPYFTI